MRSVPYDRVDHRLAGTASLTALFVRRWGTGPSVFYVHGLGASSRYWSTLAEHAVPHEGTAPDLLGFGRSPKPADVAYDVATHLEHLLPLLPDRSLVVGHSTGAILAAALARAAPDRVRSLLLLGLPAFPDRPTAQREISRLGTMARLTASNSWTAHAMCRTMCRLCPLLIPLAPRLARDVPAEVAGDFLRHTWPSYRGTLRKVVLDHPAIEDLRDVDAPVLLLHGRADRDAPLELAERMAGQLRDAGRPVRLRVVDDGDHHLALRRPRTVTTALAELLT